MDTKRAENDERIVDAGHGIRYQFGETISQKMTLTVWRGARAKPVCHGIVNSRTHGLSVVNVLVGKSRREATEKEARRIAAKSEQERQRSLYGVGSILCNSWGFEQTNVDYYQVVARSKSGASVTVRQIGFYDRSTEEERKQMLGKVAPKPDQFIGEPMTKRITRHGVQFKYGSTTLCKATDEHRTSHYG